MMKAIAGAAAVGILWGGGTATAGPAFDISGAWAGAGYVQKDDASRPMDVRCEIEGARNDDVIGFDGECRAMLIVRRAIGANLVFDGERFRGSYTGSRAGLAELDGAETPERDRVVLTMRFPRMVNGDDVAVMTIHLHDEHTFTIETVDRMQSGTELTTALIRFERK